jgi:DMSO/TMAO reductase YedYZ molybdopterin-dependent catalytic subunit
MDRLDMSGVPSRRALLKLGAAIGTGAVLHRLAAAEALAQASEGRDARLIVRSARPVDLETPVALLDEFITPVEAFFVRSHMLAPQVDLRSWRLAIDGEVATSLSLSLDDLRAMPAESVTATLECAGNGRAFFEPPVAGVQWARGAVGTARWGGVRLAALLRRAGVTPGSAFVHVGGGDRPLGSQPLFVRQLPLAKALHQDTLVALTMNDRPLTADHGFPFRLIVPGWEGAYSVKWLNRLTVATGEEAGFWVSTAYRYPIRRGAPGAPVDAKDLAPLMGLAVKSLITRPLDGSLLKPGRVTVAGFAWAGAQDIARVDVSTDGGATWRPARLVGPRLRFAWRRFEHTFDAARTESYTVLSRATDDGGRTQPAVPAWNPGGYLWNAPDVVRIDVGTAPAGTSAARPMPSHDAAALETGRSVYERACLACHDGTLIEAQRLTPAAWARSIAKMVQWGARVGAPETDALAAYLASRWGAP